MSSRSGDIREKAGPAAPRVHLNAGQSALFGYGSLLSMPSLERTLGRTYVGPFLRCALPGWRRTWDAAMPNSTFYAETADGKVYPERILYLNIRPDPQTQLSGVLFVVDPEDLANFDKREWIYRREEISDLLNGVVEGGPAYVYVCKSEHCLTAVGSPRQAAVRASYVQIVENGLSSHGNDFRSAYEQSSDPVPQRLVIQDRS